MGLCNIDPSGVNINPGNGNNSNNGSVGNGNVGRGFGSNRYTSNLVPGDSLLIKTPPLFLRGEKLDEENFEILFAISDQLFATPILEILLTPEEQEYSRWEDYEYSDEGPPDDMYVLDSGAVTVEIMPANTRIFRRGSYIYSIRAKNIHTGFTSTLAEGSILVRYNPSSVHRDIPYKDY